MRLWLSACVCVSLSLSTGVSAGALSTERAVLSRAQVGRLRGARPAAAVVGVHHAGSDTTPEAQGLAGFRHLRLLRERAPARASRASQIMMAAALLPFSLALSLSHTLTGWLW